MIDLTLTPKYENSPVGLILKKYLTIALKDAPSDSEHAAVRKEILLSLNYPHTSELKLSSLFALSNKDFEEALYLLREFNGLGKTVEAMFVNGAEIFKSSVFVQNKLLTKFDAEKFRYSDGKKQYRITDLSREDLLQVACAGLDVLNKTKKEQYSVEALVASWQVPAVK